MSPASESSLVPLCFRSPREREGAFAGPFRALDRQSIAYGGYSSAGRAPDCGSGCRGFEPHYPPHTVAEGRSVRSGPRLTSTLGCSQVVRHGTLTPAFAGSSPAIPATSARATLTRFRLRRKLARSAVPPLPRPPEGRRPGGPGLGDSFGLLPLLSPQSLEGGFAGAPLGAIRPSSSVGRATPF